MNLNVGKSVDKIEKGNISKKSLISQITLFMV